MNLVEKLQAKQTALHLPDAEFAAQLGVSTDQWRSVGSGRRGIGELFLRGVVKAFPDLQGDVLFYLGLTGPKVHDVGTVAEDDELVEAG